MWNAPKGPRRISTLRSNESHRAAAHSRGRQSPVPCRRGKRNRSSQPRRIYRGRGDGRAHRAQVQPLIRIRWILPADDLEGIRNYLIKRYPHFAEPTVRDLPSRPFPQDRAQSGQTWPPERHKRTDDYSAPLPRSLFSEGRRRRNPAHLSRRALAMGLRRGGAFQFFFANSVLSRDVSRGLKTPRSSFEESHCAKSSSEIPVRFS